MLQITVAEQEYFDDNTEMFVTIPSQTLCLEHSLYSISKWEEKWHKAFLGKKEKTKEEEFDYIRCMTINENVNPLVYSGLTTEQYKKISSYINGHMSATYINSFSEEKSSDTITSELIYYWMVALQIPFECQRWHLSRLLALIKICNVKNKPNGRVNKHDIMRRNSALNAQRRAKFKSKG